MEETVASIQLTDRDIAILSVVNEQAFVVSGQIYQAFWSETSVRSGAARQRLTKLVEAGLVKIVETRIDHKKLRLFLITEKGIGILKEEKLDHGLREIAKVGSIPIEHTLKLVNVRQVFRALGQYRWRSERVIRKEDTHRRWYPDAILEVHRLRIAIELENTFRSKERYLDRFRRYELDQEFSLVIFVVSWPRVIGWLLGVDAPQDKISFVLYDDLVKKKGDSELFNQTSRIRLASIL